MLKKPEGCIQLHKLVSVKLLLVEDEERLARILAKGMSADGFTVDVCHDGAEGLMLATTRYYDLLVLDIMLPNVNGFEICRRVRAEGGSVPILMLTAQDAEMDEIEGLEAGADDYLTKPFSYLVLMARIKALLRRSGTAPGSVLTIGELRIDCAARVCTRAGRRISLTAREFAVLEFLASRAGEAVSKAEILEEIWDEAYEGDPNIVEVYVRNLRKKIDLPFGRSTLKTLRGVGYRLADD